MNDTNEKKESILRKGIKIFNKIPKVGKTIIILLLVVLFSYTGISITSNFRNQTRATQFGLNDMDELVTQTAYVTVVQDSKVDKEFFNLFKIPFSESRMIFSYDFAVDASVDFEKISYKIDDKKKKINVSLPHAKHYKTTMIIDSQVIYLDEESLFSRIDLKKINEALLQMESKAKDTAIGNNLFESADKNAQKIIEAMFKSDPNRKNYNIIYTYID